MAQHELFLRTKKRTNRSVVKLSSEKRVEKYDAGL